MGSMQTLEHDASIFYNRYIMSYLGKDKIYSQALKHVVASSHSGGKAVPGAANQEAIWTTCLVLFGLG